MADPKDYSENDSENQNDGNNDDDNFGLPELDYKPLESDEEKPIESSTTEQESVSETTTETESTYSYTPVEESKSNAPIIITIIIALVVIVSGYLVYKFVYVPKKEKEKKELLAKQEADKKKKEEAARIAKEKEEAEARRRQEEEAAKQPEKPVAGVVETLSERTGRYYVVVSSAIDMDLTMDYAKKLSEQGVAVKIIPPFGKSKFYRLTIGDYDTVAEAETNANAAKSNYGDAVWVIKY
jgi:hypothetical protein